MNHNPSSSPQQIIETLLRQDPFSNWMKVKIIGAGEGHCKIQCRIRDNMTNGFGITHGGIIFSIADTALAFSASTYGKVALALDNSISFTNKSVAGDILTASSSAINITRKIGLFDVRIKNQNNITIAMMKGTVYRTGKSDGNGKH